VYYFTQNAQRKKRKEAQNVNLSVLYIFAGFAVSLAFLA